MDVKVQETKEYDKFKYLQGNRNIDSKHVNSLMESIKNQNLLAVRPILIDKDWNILDGQHRLEAAKLLNVSVFYFQINSTSHTEMIRLNQNNKNWKVSDFLNFHAIKNKNPNYLKILQTMNQFGWNIQEFFIYSGYEIRKTKKRKDFEEGLYIFENEEEEFSKYFSVWKTLKDFVCEKGLEHADCVDALNFKESFLFFMTSKAIKADQFWEKIRGNPSIFHRCRNKDEYLDMFLRIYNQGVTYKIEKGMLT